MRFSFIVYVYINSYNQLVYQFIGKARRLNYHYINKHHKSTAAAEKSAIFVLQNGASSAHVRTAWRPGDYDYELRAGQVKCEWCS